MNKTRKTNLKRKVLMEKSSSERVKISSTDSLTMNLVKKKSKYSIVQNSYDENSLILKKELCKGGYGCVYDAIYKNDSVIVKRSLNEENNKFTIEEYKYLNLLQNGRFRGIPKVYHSSIDEGKQYFVMEKLGTDLNKLRRKMTEKKFSLETTLLIALQVLKILKSIHSRGILHNDIKQ